MTERPTYQVEPVAIIGTGVRLPQANSLDEFWQHLDAERSLISELPHERFDPDDPRNDLVQGSGAKGVWGGFIEDADCFDASFFGISPKEASFMDPQQRFGLEMAWHALEDAGIKPSEVAGSKTGVYMGVCHWDYAELLEKHYARTDAYMPTGIAYAIIANRISHFFDFQGPSITNDTACAASMTSIYEAVRAIQSGECDMALAGGVNLIWSPNHFSAFSKAGMLSKSGKSQAFDAGADGYVRGEGGAVLLLKPLRQAEADGDNIQGIIRGIGLNHGGRTNSLTVTNPDAQAALIQSVYRSANINIDTVDYIEAHGPGTPLGDPIEIAGLKQAFATLYSEAGLPVEPEACGIGSVKTNIGHLEGAAGVAGVIKVLAALKHEKIPANVGFKTLNPMIDLEGSPFSILAEPRMWNKGAQPRRAGVSSFGFGGSNGHILIEGYDRPAAEGDSRVNDRDHFVPLSAKSEDQLRTYASLLHAYLEQDQDKLHDIADIAHTYQTGRESMDTRVVFKAKNSPELCATLRCFIDGKVDKNILFANNRDAEATDVQEWLEGKAANFDHYTKAEAGRISAPVYPFARERHWMDVFAARKDSADVPHPLLHRNISNFDHVAFETTLSGDEPVWSDHHVGDDQILPGTVFAEMIYSSVSIMVNDATKRLAIQNMVILRPVMGGEGLVTLETRLKRVDEKTISVEIVRRDKAGESSAVVQASVKLEEQTEMPSVSLSQLVDEMPEIVSVEECYETLVKSGVHHGPLFQVLKQVKTDGTQVLAQLKLPRKMAASHKKLPLHPLLLDGAIQAWVGLGSEASGGAAVPFSCDAIEVYQACEPEMWVHLRPNARDAKGTSLQHLDIVLMNKRGAVCVLMKNLVLRAMADKAVAGNTLKDTVIVKPQWRKAMLLDAEQSSAHNIQLYGLGAIEATVRASAADMEVTSVSLPAANYQDLSSAALTCYRALHTNLASWMQGGSPSGTDKGTEFVLVLGDDVPDAVSAPMLALLKTAVLENPKLRASVIRCDQSINPHALGNIIKTETSVSGGFREIRYHGDGYRHLRHFEMENAVSSAPDLKLDPNAVYWITGGAGGLGQHFTEWLIASGAKRILLTGRRETISDALRHKLNEYSAAGLLVAYRQCDLAVINDVNAIIAWCDSEMGPIKGIIHAAGVLDDGFIFNQNASALEKVFAPKVSGLVNLDQATSGFAIDFMVLCSSVAASFGNSGQAFYAGANAFMDGFAQHRNSLTETGARAGKTVSVAWPLWADGGMSVDDATLAGMKKRWGIQPLPSDVGLLALGGIIAKDTDHSCTIMHGDVGAIGNFLAEFGGDQEPAVKDDAPVAIAGVGSAASDGALKKIAVAHLREVFADVLQFEPEELRVNRKLEEYGLESISIVEATNKLEEIFGPLSKTLLFEYVDIQGLAAYFTENHADALSVQTEEPDATASISIAETIQPSHAVVQDMSEAQPLAAEGVEGMHDIAIVGMSLKVSKADDQKAFWQMLQDGIDGFEPWPESRWNHEAILHPDRDVLGKTVVKTGAFLDDIDKFDPRYFRISQAEAEIMSPEVRLFLEASVHAFEDAGYSREYMQQAYGGDVAVIMGSMTNEYHLYGFQNMLMRGSRASGSYTGTVPNMVSYYYGFTGPSYFLDTMCSASSTCVHEAVHMLRAGRCKMALAGGMSLLLHPQKLIATSQEHFTTKTADVIRGYGVGADGTILGEGGGALVLKTLADAQRDGDQIYGVIKGSGISNAGVRNGFTVPNPGQQAKAIEDALADAKLDASTISYIEGHGSGTALGDPIEIKALTQVYGQRGLAQQSCPVGTVKSNVAHLLAASGLAGLAKVLMQFKHKKIAPSLHSQELNPDIPFERTPFYVPQCLSSWDTKTDEHGRVLPRRAGVTSIGAGGMNSHIILEEYVDNRPQRATSAREDALIVLSAMNTDALNNVIGHFCDYLDEAPDVPLSDIAYTSQVGKNELPCRLTIIANSHSDAAEKLRAFLRGGSEDGAIKFVKSILDQDPPDDGDIIENAISKRQLETVAEMWTKGAPINWMRFNEGQTHRRVSLPQYPFERVRCWYDDYPDAPSVINPLGSRSKYHPFVGQNTSNLSGLSYETTLYLEEMQDYTYRIHNQTQVIPVMAAETALAIGRVAGLENDLSLEGLSVHGLADWSHVSQVTYRVESVSPTSVKIQAAANIEALKEPWFDVVVHSNVAPSHQPFDLQGALTAAHEVIDHAALYKAFLERGLRYGPYLETIDAVYNLRGNRLLAKLRHNSPQQDGFKKNVQITAPALAAAYQLMELVAPDSWAATQWSMDTAYCAVDDIAFVLLSTNDDGTHSLSFMQKDGLVCALFDRVDLRENVARDSTKPEADPMMLGGVSGHENPKSEQVAGRLKEIAGAILKFPAADILSKELFHDLGFDSITLTQYAQDINKALAVDLSPAVFFDCAHIEALSHHLLDRYNPIIVAQPQKAAVKAEAVALEKIKPLSSLQKSAPINETPYDAGDELIAVIGMAGRFPGANSVDDLFACLRNGDDLIGDLPLGRYPAALRRGIADADFVKRGGFIDGVDLFDASYFKISPFEAQRLDPQQRLMLETVIHSLDDAGYDQTELPKDTGVFVGVSALDYSTLLKAAGAKTDGYSATGNSLAMVANRVSHFLDIQGPSLAIDTACSSSLIALNQAVNAIKQGTCQMAIAGGVNLCLAQEGFEGPLDAGMLSPTGYCHSFGEAADGYVRGEGVVSVVLKKYSEAVRDGDMIYGNIIGTAQNHGGHSGSLTAPNVQAQSSLIKAAMGRIDARSISYIEAHGTGTQLGDAVEVSALKQAYEELLGQQEFEVPFISLGSIKSNIGHLEAAAGLAGVIKVLLAMRHQTLPQSLHCQTVNPHLGLKKSPFNLVTATMPWINQTDQNGTMVPLRAGVSSFGFGGGNAHVVLEQAPATYKPRRARRPATVFNRKSHWLAGMMEGENKAPDLPVVLCPVWAEKTREEGAVVQAVRRVVLPINMDVASTSFADVYPLKLEGGEPAHNYTAAAKHVFKQLKNLIINQPEAPVFVQLLVPDISEPDGYMSGLFAMFETAAAEEPRLQVQLVCCEKGYSPQELAELLSAEAGSPDKYIRHFGGRRYVQTWNSPQINTLPRRGFSGVSLITGGMGGIGKGIATWIAGHSGPSTIVLTGRSALTTADEDFIAALNTQNVKVIYRQIDITNADAVKELVDRTVGEFGSLNHILHCAGSIKDSYILQKHEGDFDAVLSAKVSGTLALARASEAINLDSFVLFSSLAGITGNEGQVDYAAANGFMDVFAAASGGRVLSINWPYWQDGGMAMDEASIDQLYQQMGQRPMKTELGLNALKTLSSSRLSRAAVISGDEDKVQQYFADHMLVRQAATQTQNAHSRVRDNHTHTSILSAVRKSLRGLFAKVSGADASDIEGDVLLEDYGIDSLMITRLNTELAEVFGALSKTLFFQFKTLNAVADYLVRDKNAACKNWVGLEAGAENMDVVEIPNNTPDQDNAQHLPIESSASEPIAIIGISGQYPGCENLDQFWQTLITERDVITDIPPDRWSMDDFYENDMDEAIAAGKSYTKKGAFLERFAHFDPLFFKISPRDAAAMDPQERWFLSASWQAMENAGYSPQRLKERTKGQVGVFAGVCKVGYALHGPYENEDGITVRPTTSFASVANRVSHILDLSGPSMPIDTMCSSSLTAIHEACAYLHKNRHAMAFAGGVNLYLHPSNYTELCASRMLSPDGLCKSFGDGANGFVPGEGVGCVLLKPLSAAIADGDYIHGVIRGSAVNHGGHNNGYTVPNPLAQRDVVYDAMRAAGVTAEDISYIEAHGTGTALGDPIEIEGLTQAFAFDTDTKNFCAIGSVKSVFGHLEAAAGIAGLTRVICQMQHGQLAPTRHAEVINPNIDFATTPLRLQRTLEPWNTDKRRIAGVSSFGAGGANAHIIIEEAPQRTSGHVAQSPVDTEEVIVLSAKNREGLVAQAKRLLDHLKNCDEQCGTANINVPAVPAITKKLCAILNVEAADIQVDDSLDTLGMEPHHWIMLERWLNETYQHSLQEAGLSAQSTITDIARSISSEPKKAEGREMVSLAHVAYTLQVGRAQMEHRLGLTACTIMELQSKLSLWLNGQHTESKVIQSEDKSTAAAIRKMLGADALESALINHWNQRDFEKFLALWTAGVSVNWESLPRVGTMHAVPLPTYPFDMQKFWMPIGTDQYDYDVVVAEVVGAAGDKDLREADDRFEERIATLLRAILADTDPAAIINQYKAWYIAALALVNGEGDTKPIDKAWADWRAYEPLSTVNLSRAKLATIALSDLKSVLTGQKKATDVLFPGGDLGAVEAVYKENPIAARFSHHTANTAASFVRDKVAKSPLSKIKILEIGAGTGGTSQLIFKALRPYENNIDTYCYTDVSRAFLIHAEQQFSDQVPYLKTVILDIEKPVDGGGINTDDYDLVIAANVLHATADIVETLKNVRQMLKPNGMLLLNETSKATLFTHITFGLLDGWWRFTDGERRIAGTPSLTSSSWSEAMQQSGFECLAYSHAAEQALGQQIIAAGADGKIRKQRAQVNVVKAVSTEPRVNHVVTPGGTEEALKLSLARTLNMQPDKIDADQAFADLGLDSILGAEWVRRIRSELDIPLDQTLLYDSTNLQELTDFVEKTWPDACNKPSTLSNTEHSAPVKLNILDDQQTIDDADQYALNTSVSDDLIHGKKAQREPIAIVGMSGRFAGSDTIDELWGHLMAGDDLVQPVTRFDLDELYKDTPKGTYGDKGSFLKRVDLFDSVFFGISGVEATYMDPQQRLFLEEAWKTLEHAGHAGDDIVGSECGVFVGCSHGDYQELFDANIPGQAFWGNTSSLIPARISYWLDLKGPAVAVDTACSSSLVAVNMACRSIWDGECKAALAGGVFVQSGPRFFRSANQAQMLSPSGNCAAFGEMADGIVPGEAVAAVLLRPLSDAIADGDTIYGVIVGTGTNQDGATNGITAPSAKSQERLIRKVQTDFDIDANSIGMIEAHGTGTPLGDPIEFNALNRVFGETKQGGKSIFLGSVKSNIGHATTAAGICGLVRGLMSLRHGVVPPTLHAKKPNPSIALDESPFILNDTVQNWPAKPGQNRRFAINSFGFSGTNVHLVVQEPPQNNAQPEAAARPYLFVLSARTSDQLRQQVDNLASFLQDHADLKAQDVAYTLMVGRRHFHHRIAVVANDLSDLVTKLSQWQLDTVNEHVVAGVCDPKPSDNEGDGEAIVSDLIREINRKAAAAERCTNELVQLADQFIGGRRIPYADMFSVRAKRVALPAYPLAGKSYWVRSLSPSASIVEAEGHMALNISSEPAAFGKVRLIDPARSVAETVPTGKTRVSLMPVNDFEAGINDAQQMKCKTEKAAGVFTISVSEGERLNLTHLCRAIAGAEQQDDVGAIVIQGLEKCRTIDHAGAQSDVLYACKLPVIAIIANDILSAGLSIALHADFIVASNEALLSCNPDKVDIEGQLLARRFSRQALDALSSNPSGVSAKSLIEYGCGLRVAPVDDVYNRALLLARSVADAPRVSIDALKHHMRRTREIQPYDDCRTFESLLKGMIEKASVEDTEQAYSGSTIPLKTDLMQLSIAPDGVMTLRMKDTESSNSFTDPFMDGFEEAFSAIAQQTNGKVVVLTGFDTYFAVGGTAGGLQKLQEGETRFTDRKVYNLPLFCDLPVIAAMQGHAVGAGWSMGMFADLVVFASEGVYHSNYMWFGFTPGAGATLALPQRLGDDLSREVLFSAREYRGEELKERAPWLTVLPSKQVLTEAQKMAHALALYSRADLTAAKKEQSRHLRASISGVLSQELAMHQTTFVGNKRVQSRIAEKFAGTKINANSSDIKAAKNPNSKVRLYVIDSLAKELMIASEDVQEDMGFLDLGMDSILAVTWVRRLNEVLETDIPATAVYACPTVGAMIKKLEGSVPTLSTEQTPRTETPIIEPSTDSDQGGHAAQSKANLGSDTRERVIASLAEELMIDAGEIRDDISFLELGLDSILAVTWIRRLNTMLGLDLPATVVYACPNLGSVLETIAIAMPQQTPIGVQDKPASSVPIESAPPIYADAHAETNAVELQTSVKSVSESSDTPPAIAIIGASGAFPKAETLDAFWQNLRDGINCITTVEPDRWDIDTYYHPDETHPGTSYCKWVGRLDHVDEFDPLFFNITPREAALMDPQQRLFLQHAWHAIENAAIDPLAMAGAKCGVYASAGDSGYGDLIHDKNAYSLSGNSSSILAARISYFLDLRGPSMSIDTACSSSLVGITEACEAIASGRCDTALAGGVNIMIGPDMFVDTSKVSMLSKTGQCYTFDQRADGFVPGEGIGVILLKRLDAAIRDGDPVRAVIKGWGTNQDGRTNGITAPNPVAQTTLMQDVYDRFDIDPATIGLVECHGTGTPLGDPIEIEGLTDAFSSVSTQTKSCHLGSVKSNIGHLLAAAGVAGALKGMLALENKQKPPLIHFKSCNEHIDLSETPFEVNTQLANWTSDTEQPRRVAVSAFGFSGTNAHIVLEQAPTRKVEEHRRAPLLFTLSAKTKDRLQDALKDMAAFVEQDPRLDISAFAFSLQVGRSDFKQRIAFVYETYEELCKSLKQALASEQVDGVYRSNEADESRSLFGDDTEMAGLIEGWLRSNTAGDLKKLAKLWVEGVAVNWQAVPKATRIAVPGYAFARGQYWAKPKETTSEHVETAAPAKKEAVTPQPNPKSQVHASEQAHTENISVPVFLNGHSETVASWPEGQAEQLPPLLLSELAREALQQISGSSVTGLKHLLWGSPVDIGALDSGLSVIISQDDEGRLFRIVSKDGHASPYHLAEEMRADELPERPEEISVDTILSQQALQSDFSYITQADTWSARGLNVTTVHKDETSLMLHVKRSRAIESGEHADLFDVQFLSAVSAAGAFANNALRNEALDNQSASIFSLENLVSYGPLDDEVWLKITPGATGDGHTSNMTFYGNDGKARLLLKNLHMVPDGVGAPIALDS